MGKIREIQIILGVTPDSIWGPKSQEALNALLQADGFWISQQASSFADPADLVAFKKWKAIYQEQGLSESEAEKKAFAKGDNGIGQFGRITAQDTIPMVAVHGSAMRARWGSVAAAAHRPVQVTANGRTINATVEDRVSAKGRIDLNPACAKLLGLTPPFLVPARWRWL